MSSVDRVRDVYRQLSRRPVGGPTNSPEPAQAPHPAPPGWPMLSTPAPILVEHFREFTSANVRAKEQEAEYLRRTTTEKSPLGFRVVTVIKEARHG